MTQSIVDLEPRPDDARRGLLWLGGAAVLYSFIPLVLEISGSTTDPMTVGAGFLVGVGISMHFTRHLAPDFRPIKYRQLVHRCLGHSGFTIGILLPFAFIVLNTFGYVVFAWATVYIDTAVASSLFELWPILWMLSMLYIDRRRHGTDDYRIVPSSTKLLMILGAGAITLIIYSTATPESSGHALSLPIAGIALGILAPLVGALGTFYFLSADRIMFGAARNSENDWDLWMSSENRQQIEESIVQTLAVIARVCAAPVVILLSVLEGGFPSALVSRSFAGGLLCGLLLNGPGNLLLVKGHVVTSRREIISLQYLSPVLALFWLSLFTDIDVTRLDFLIFGTVSIVALNMLINADPERKKSSKHSDQPDASGIGVGTIQERYSLKALVVSLLGFGMLVFFRDELLVGHDLSWEDPGSYWGVLALGSTIFALLLAFRLTRVESLLLSEDYRTLGIVRRAEILPDNVFTGVDEEDSRSTLLSWIRALNRANTPNEYRRAYDEANRICQRVARRVSSGQLQLSYEEKREFSELRTELDALAHGRQLAREFAERVALWLIGALVVLLCLAVPSEQHGWPRLLSEIFVVMLSSVVVYLLFHLADMRRSRADELVTDGDPSSKKTANGLRIRFRDDEDAKWQRIFAGIVILGVVSTVVGLLAWSRLASI